MTPIKSPNLLMRPIESGYHYVVNCSFPNSLRILNADQFSIIKAVDNATSTKELCNKLSIPAGDLESFFNLLSETEIITYEDGFSVPAKPKNPESLNFWIHTTNSCNLGCSYCYISTLNTTKGMPENIQRQLLHKLVETVNNRKIKKITLRLAGGEPLSQFKFWKLFIPEAKRILMELGCDLAFSFVTNLTILTNEILSFSKEQGVSFGVSIDGLGCYNDATRSFRSGGGSFNIVDAHLRKLIAHSIPVSVNTVISNGNLEGLPGLTRYLIELDIPFRYAIVKGQDIKAEWLEKYLAESYAIMEDALKTGWRFSHRHRFCDLKPNELGFQTCASGFSGGAIYVDGTMNYCHVHFGDDQQPSGTIFDDGLDLVDLIEQGSHPEDMKSSDCNLCKYKSVCTSGCPVYRIDGKDPQCSIYHKFIPIIYDLQARERLKLLRDYQII